VLHVIVATVFLLSSCLATIQDSHTQRLVGGIYDVWHTLYAIEMGSGAMIYISNFMNWFGRCKICIGGYPENMVIAKASFYFLKIKKKPKHYWIP
jgi:hypothetical protein